VLLDCCIFVVDLLFDNYVVEKMLPKYFNRRTQLIFVYLRKKQHTAFALPPTCMALNMQKKINEELAFIRKKNNTEVEAIPNWYRDL